MKNFVLTVFATFILRNMLINEITLHQLLVCLQMRFFILGHGGEHNI